MKFPPSIQHKQNGAKYKLVELEGQEKLDQNPTKVNVLDFGEDYYKEQELESQEKLEENPAEANGLEFGDDYYNEQELNSQAVKDSSMEIMEPIGLHFNSVEMPLLVAAINLWNLKVYCSI